MRTQALYSAGDSRCTRSRGKTNPRSIERATLTRFDAEPFKILILCDMCLSTRLNRLPASEQGCRCGVRDARDAGSFEIFGYLCMRKYEICRVFPSSGENGDDPLLGLSIPKIPWSQKVCHYCHPRPSRRGGGSRIRDKDSDTRSKQNRRTRSLPLRARRTAEYLNEVGVAIWEIRKARARGCAALLAAPLECD